MAANDSPQAGWQTYLVGGAVRDGLLDLPVVERDWVVVGATPQQMIDAGFEPVDADFPVFRHPQTGEEYALARRETKQGEGYRGFVVDASADVTLEEDLRRRDLTINAIARAEDGTLVDPYGGRDDLDAGLLRHVSPAFVEDPLRVLRIARFAAKLGRFGFRVAHPTHRLLREMVARGDMRHLTAERTWREMFKAMRTEQPWRFFEVLQRCGALQELLPVVAAAMGQTEAHTTDTNSQAVAVLKRASRLHAEPAARMAALLLACVDSRVAGDALLAGLRADRATAQLLQRVLASRDTAERARHGDVEALYRLLTLWRGLDAGADVVAPAAVLDAQYPDPVLCKAMPVARTAALTVTADRLRESGLSGEALGKGLAVARRDAIATALRDAGLLT